MEQNMTELGEVAQFINGYGFKRTDWTDSGRKIIRIQNLTKSSKRFNLTDKVVPAKYVVNYGDILLSWAGTLGVYRWQQEQEALLNQHIFKVLPDKSKVDADYLAYGLDYALASMQKYVHGATVKHIKRKEFLSSKIYLPALPEQRRIAALLNQANALRSKRKATQDKLDTLLQAIFIEIFGHPANSPYPIMPLNRVCHHITDGIHKKPTYVTAGVPFLRVTDIRKKKIEWETCKKIPHHEHRELIKYCQPRQGDVLYSKNGTIGVPRLVDWERDFSIFVSLALLRPNPAFILGDYLEAFLKTPFALRQAKKRTKTEAVSNLHLVEIRKMKLPIPPLAVQKEWLRQKKEIDRQKQRLSHSAKTLDNLFHTLQQRAFRGEL